MLKRLLNAIPQKIQGGLAVAAFAVAYMSLMLYTGLLLSTPGFP